MEGIQLRKKEIAHTGEGQVSQRRREGTQTIELVLKQGGAPSPTPSACTHKDYRQTRPESPQVSPSSPHHVS